MTGETNIHNWMRIEELYRKINWRSADKNYPTLEEMEITEDVISAIDTESVERLQSFYIDSRAIKLLEAEADYHQISVEKLIRKIITNHIERL